MTEKSRARGVVELEAVDKDGAVIDRRTLDNVVCYEFRNQMASWMAGRGAYDASSNPTGWKLPGYVAVGIGTSAENQKAVAEMTEEVFRADFGVNPVILSNGTRFRAVFAANDIAVDITELMMFDEDATTVLVSNCDTITDWTTGTNQTLSAQTSGRREGTGYLQAVTTGAGSTDVSFRRQWLSEIDGTGTDRMQLWFYVDDKAKLGATVTIELSSSTTDNADEWQWSVAVSGLSNGWNFLELEYGDASTTGTPDITGIVRFRLYVTKTHPVTLGIDFIRLYAHDGTGLARTELSPAFEKAIGSILNVTWMVMPDYENKANTFLWHADTDEYAYVADIKTLLVETGSGTYPTVASHPWLYTDMWLPAGSGYMTGGREALDATQGTVAMFIQFAASPPTSAALQFRWREDGNNQMYMWWSGVGRWEWRYNEGGTLTYVVQNDTATDDEYAFVVFTWDNNSSTIGISLNGGARSTDTPPSMLSGISTEPTWGGGSGGTTTNCNIGPCLIFDRALSDSEISTLYALGRRYVYGEQ